MTLSTIITTPVAIRKNVRLASLQGSIHKRPLRYGRPNQHIQLARDMNRSTVHSAAAFHRWGSLFQPPMEKTSRVVAPQETRLEPCVRKSRTSYASSTSYDQSVESRRSVEGQLLHDTSNTKNDTSDMLLVEGGEDVKGNEKTNASMATTQKLIQAVKGATPVCSTSMRSTIRATLHNVSVEIWMKDRPKGLEVGLRIRCSCDGSTCRRSDTSWRSRPVEVARDTLRSLATHVCKLSPAFSSNGARVAVSEHINWKDGMCWGGNCSYDPSRDGVITLIADTTIVRCGSFCDEAPQLFSEQALQNAAKGLCSDCFTIRIEDLHTSHTLNDSEANAVVTLGMVVVQCKAEMDPSIGHIS